MDGLFGEKPFGASGRYVTSLPGRRFVKPDGVDIACLKWNTRSCYVVL